MFARVTVVDGLTDQWEKAKQLLTTQAVPRTRELRGCCASYWLGDPKTGKRRHGRGLEAGVDPPGGWEGCLGRRV
jgi:hypothetical protein